MTTEELRALRDSGAKKRPYRVVDTKKHAEIVEKYLTTNASLRQLGKEYGVSHSRIQQIVKDL